jgi:hypothetical protein
MMKPWEHWTGLRSMAACGLALVLGWAFHGRVIAPLKQREAVALRDGSELKARLDGAQNLIAGIQAEEQHAEGERSEMKRLESELPAGSAMFWLPPLVKRHLERSGFADALVSLSAIRDEPRIPGCERSFWSVRLPIDAAGRNVPTLLLAVADLDQQNPFVRVLDFSTRPDPDDRMRRLAVIEVGTLSPKGKDSR